MVCEYVGLTGKSAQSAPRRYSSWSSFTAWRSAASTKCPGGQRIGLARALAIEPQLLLLDEPLSNVDQVTKFEVASELKKVFERIDIPVLLVTHGHEDALFLAGHLAVMVDGKIEQVGPVKKVMQSPKTDLIKRLLRPFGDPDEQRVAK